MTPQSQINRNFSALNSLKPEDLRTPEKWDAIFRLLENLPATGSGRRELQRKLFAQYVLPKKEQEKLTQAARNMFDFLMKEGRFHKAEEIYKKADPRLRVKILTRVMCAILNQTQKEQDSKTQFKVWANCVNDGMIFKYNKSQNKAEIVVHAGADNFLKNVSLLYQAAITIDQAQTASDSMWNTRFERYPAPYMINLKERSGYTTKPNDFFVYSNQPLNARGTFAGAALEHRLQALSMIYDPKWQEKVKASKVLSRKGMVGRVWNGVWGALLQKIQS